MATLLARLAAQHADPFHADWSHPEDLFSLGALFEALAEHERAARCYERAAEIAPSREARARAMVRLGNLYKRLRQRQDAAAIWQALASGGHVYTTFAYVELAKHHEHVTRDYIEAERLTLQALAALELRVARGLAWHVQSERRDLEHRLARLRRKLRG
jgi:tetratricopeptide (TPR) repeat protein